MLFGSACFVLRSEGEQMQQDIDQLKNEIATLQRERSDMQQRLNSRLQGLENTTFKRNADSGLEQNRLVTELQQLRGQLEETQHRLEDLQSAPPPKVVVPPPAPEPVATTESKAELFARAKKLYDAKKYDQAIEVFDDFVEEYKDDKNLASQAYFMRGDAYFMRAKKSSKASLKKDLYKKAVLSFQEILTRYPNFKRTHDTLMKIGQSLDAMGYRKDAAVFYREAKKKP